jgi:hypothetical protein
MDVSGHLHTLATLPLGENPWYALDTRMGGPQSRSGRGGEKKNPQPLPGLEPPIIQPVVQRCTTYIWCQGKRTREATPPLPNMSSWRGTF